MRAPRGALLRILGCLALLFALATPAAAERRVALVLGNSTYQSVVALSNPRNDAEDVASSLRDLGFEVMLRTDVQKNDLRTLLKDFSRLVVGADTALVYYAGHALQYRGRYYLMPVDAVLEDEDALKFDMLSADDVREVLGRVAGVRIMIFDACRNDPFSEKPLPDAVPAPQGATRGLVRVSRAQGTVIAFATAPFDVAEDGKARNSPFTRAFLARVKEPGVEIGQMFRLITKDVHDLTGGRQTPEITISMLDDYYLNRAESDSAFWARIRFSEQAADFRDFVSRFPSSPHVGEARFRLETLEVAGRALEEARRQAEQHRIAEERRQTDQRAAEVCAGEAREVDAGIVGRRRDALAALKDRAKCADTPARIERALADLTRREAEEKARQEAEAIEQARIERCRGEALQIDGLAGAGKRRDLDALRSRSTCGDNVRRIETVLADLTRREDEDARTRADAEAARAREAICLDEERRIAERAGAHDVEQLRMLQAQAHCPRSAAAATLAIDAARAEIERACDEERRAIERLRAAGPAGRDGLSKMLVAARCATSTPLVTAALEAVTPPARVDPPSTALDPRLLLARVQTALKRVGCWDGDIDAGLTEATRVAFSRYLERRKVKTERDRPLFDDTLLARLEAEPDGRICSPICRGGEVERNGLCIEKPRPIARERARPEPRAQPGPTAERTPPPEPKRAEPPAPKALKPSYMLGL